MEFVKGSAKAIAAGLAAATAAIFTYAQAGGTVSDYKAWLLAAGAGFVTGFVAYMKKNTGSKAPAPSP